MYDLVSQEELDYFFSISYFSFNKKCLLWIGLWPYDSSWTKTAVRAAVYIVIGSIVCGPLVGGIKLWCGVNLGYCGENIAGMIFGTTMILKLFVASLSEKNLGLLYSQIVKNWISLEDPAERTILTEYAKVGKLFTDVYTIYTIIGGVAFSQVPAVPVVLDLLFPKNVSRQRIVFVNGDFRVNPEEHFLELYVIFILASLFCVGILVGNDTMYAAVLHQILGILSIIKYRLHNATLPENLKENKSCYIIVQAISLHKSAISYIEMLEAAYSLSFLAIVILTIIFISVGAITVMMSADNIFILCKLMTILVGVVLHMLYLTLPAQKIIDHTEDLYTSIYSIEWYHTSEESKRLLRFMMLRAIKPLSITAGGLYIMNLENFGSIMKSALSYMTVVASFQ